MIPVAQPSWWDGGDLAATLTKQNANGAQRMPDKDNFGAVLQPVAFKVRGGCEGGGKGYLGSEEAAFTVATTQDQWLAQPIGFHHNAQACQLPTENRDTSVSDALTCSQQAAVAMPMQVRRLTAEECEKLQGFLPGYTNIPWRGKPESPDGPRYKALGNSMAVPVMRWIGERINKVEAL